MYFLGSGSVMITSERFDQEEHTIGQDDRSAEWEWDRDIADVLYVNFAYGPKNVDVDMQFAQVLHDRTTTDVPLKTFNTREDDHRLDQEVHHYAKFRDELDAVSGLFQLENRGEGALCWKQVSSQVLQRTQASMSLFGQTRK